LVLNWWPFNRLPIDDRGKEFEMKGKIIALLMLMVILLAACGSNKTASDPTPGTFSGKTSQGNIFTLVVKNTPNGLAVTSVQYKVKVSGSGWSVTIDYVQPLDCLLYIKEGRFSGSVELNGTDAPAEFSGAFFEEKLVEGRFKQTKEHPQGLGSGTADVTFSADRSE